MKTIKFDVLDPNSIDSAIAELQNKREKLHEAKRKIASELAKIGVRVIEFRYVTNVTENEFWDVTSRPYGFGYIIEAYGDGIVFIEFGAGVSTTDYEHEGAKGLPKIEAGSWSRTEGTRAFARKGYWRHNRIKYTGYPQIGDEPQPPAHGFLFAREEMQQKAEEVVRKVLKNL